MKIMNYFVDRHTFLENDDAILKYGVFIFDFINTKKEVWIRP